MDVVCKHANVPLWMFKCLFEFFFYFCLSNWRQTPINCLCHLLIYNRATPINENSGLEVIKFFSCSTQLSTKFQLLIKYWQMKKCLALSLSDAVFIMLINVKIPTIVGILTFMGRMNFIRHQLHLFMSLFSLMPPACGLRCLSSNKVMFCSVLFR